MINLILAGPPGSGKGTQAKQLIDSYSLVHMSTGDMLRAAIAAQSPLGKEVEAIINGGNLVSDEIVFKLISERIKANPEAKGFIYDGFPRTEHQAEMLDEFMKNINSEISVMIALTVADSEVEKRMIKRSEIEHRKDEADPATIHHRIETYHKQTEPIIAYYSKQGKCTKINGEGTIEEVHAEICKILDNLK